MTDPLALVIEDDPQLSQIFTMVISEIFTVETITDGIYAQQRLSEITPQLIVLDVNLPGISGAQILQEIRSDMRLVSTRVIVVTANSRQATELHDMADIILLKPISPVQLRELAIRLKG